MRMIRFIYPGREMEWNVESTAYNYARILQIRCRMPTIMFEPEFVQFGYGITTKFIALGSLFK